MVNKRIINKDVDLMAEFDKKNNPAERVNSQLKPVMYDDEEVNTQAPNGEPQNQNIETKSEFNIPLPPIEQPKPYEQSDPSRLELETDFETTNPHILAKQDPSIDNDKTYSEKPIINADSEELSQQAQIDFQLVTSAERAVAEDRKRTQKVEIESTFDHNQCTTPNCSLQAKFENLTKDYQDEKKKVGRMRTEVEKYRKALANHATPEQRQMAIITAKNDPVLKAQQQQIEEQSEKLKRYLSLIKQQKECLEEQSREIKDFQIPLEGDMKFAHRIKELQQIREQTMILVKHQRDSELQLEKLNKQIHEKEVFKEELEFKLPTLVSEFNTQLNELNRVKERTRMVKMRMQKGGKIVPVKLPKPSTTKRLTLKGFIKSIFKTWSTPNSTAPNQ